MIFDIISAAIVVAVSVVIGDFIVAVIDFVVVVIVAVALLVGLAQ